MKHPFPQIPPSSTGPTLQGDLNFFLQSKPNGAPVLSEMGTKWRPLTAEMGTQKAYIRKIDRNRPIHWNKKSFLVKYSRRQSVSAFSAQCLCHLYWIIKWSSLDGGCTNFSRILKLKKEKNGDPKFEKCPHGDPGPQMGTPVGAVKFPKELHQRTQKHSKLMTTMPQKHFLWCLFVGFQSKIPGCSM